MRIASYNIMSGGFNDYEYTSPKPQRLAQLQTAVRILDADVIGLVDTFRWDEIFSEQEIADLFGYPYAVCINLNDDRLRKLGHNNGITILSRQEFISRKTIPLYSRDGLRVEVNGLTIYSIYLDDLSEDTRLKQVDALHDTLQLEQPTIVMGDLNTLTREQAADLSPKLETFYARNPHVRAKMEPVLKGMSRGEVIPALEACGLRDASADVAQSTVPSKLFPAVADQPFLRLDYCFSNTVISNFKVWRDEIFDETSDHYPISFELVLVL